MTMRKPREIAGAMMAAMALSAASGCGAGPPTPADPAAARQALDRALTAWKEGRPVESLKNDSPPIVISDHAWTNGASLLRYEIEPGDRRIGSDQTFRVVLWLKGDRPQPRSRTRGKAKGTSTDWREQVEYNVGTSPILTVVRPF